eukprot:g28935.t1
MVSEENLGPLHLSSGSSVESHPPSVSLQPSQQQQQVVVGSYPQSIVPAPHQVNPEPQRPARHVQDPLGGTPDAVKEGSNGSEPANGKPEKAQKPPLRRTSCTRDRLDRSTKFQLTVLQFPFYTPATTMKRKQNRLPELEGLSDRERLTRLGLLSLESRSVR